MLVDSWCKVKYTKNPPFTLYAGQETAIFYLMRTEKSTGENLDCISITYEPCGRELLKNNIYHTTPRHPWNLFHRCYLRRPLRKTTNPSEMCAKRSC
jgi:hypothetical protein